MVGFEAKQNSDSPLHTSSGSHPIIPLRSKPANAIVVTIGVSSIPAIPAIPAKQTPTPTTHIHRQPIHFPFPFPSPPTATPLPPSGSSPPSIIPLTSSPRPSYNARSCTARLSMWRRCSVKRFTIPATAASRRVRACLSFLRWAMLSAELSNRYWC